MNTSCASGTSNTDALVSQYDLFFVKIKLTTVITAE